MISNSFSQRARVFPSRWFFGCVVPVAIAHWSFIYSLIARAIGDDRLSHMLALPIVFVILLWIESDGPETASGACSIWLRLFTGLGVLSGLFGPAVFYGPLDMALHYAVIVATVSGGFACAYGWESLRRKSFIFLILAAAVPPPEALLREFEISLQRWSADGAEIVFGFIGVSYIRSAMVFSLPGLDIEVARECSGIRSAIAIQAAVLVGSRVAVGSTVSRVMLWLCAIPVAITKNALRIATLAILGSSVSPDVLVGPLHRYGGPIFTVAAALLFVPIVFVLRRTERRWGAKSV